MTREEAEREAARRQADDPAATYRATERDGEWVVARMNIPHGRPSGTATKPPPEAPAEGPPSQPGLAAYGGTGF